MITQIAGLQGCLAGQSILDIKVPLHIVRVAVRIVVRLIHRTPDVRRSASSGAFWQVVTLAGRWVRRVRVIDRRVDRYLVVEGSDERRCVLETFISHAARCTCSLQDRRSENQPAQASAPLPFLLAVAK